MNNLIDKEWFNITVLVVFLLLSFMVAWATFEVLHRPITLDYFYNPTLRMYEPVQIEITGWANLLRIPVALATYLFVESSIWFRLLYFSAGVWLFMVYLWPRLS